MGSKWIKESEVKPPFGETVLVYCRINGRFLASYEYIGDFAGDKYGNWKHEDKLGILPPVLWMEIPEIPEI